MSKKIISLALCAMLLALCFPVDAQQTKNVPRIGYISGTGDAINQGPYVAALRRGLRELGDIEGKHFTIEYRGAEGKLDRIPSLIAELVQLKVDVLVVPGVQSIFAAKKATQTIPIVMVTGLDPVAAGIVDSLARPGGNITGITTINYELSEKRLALLKEMVPRLSRVGVLRAPNDENAVIAFKEYSDAARIHKIQLRSIDVQLPNPDLEAAFQSAAKARVGALITVTTAALLLQSERIANLAIKNRLPSMFQGATWVEAGGLVSYSASDLDAYHRAATYVHKILKGTKPFDLPVERPMKFEFVINLKTAKQIGLTIPQWTLMKADKVIR